MDEPLKQYDKYKMLDIKVRIWYDSTHMNIQNKPI